VRDLTTRANVAQHLTPAEIQDPPNPTSYRELPPIDAAEESKSGANGPDSELDET